MPGQRKETSRQNEYDQQKMKYQLKQLGEDDPASVEWAHKYILHYGTKLKSLVKQIASFVHAPFWEQQLFATNNLIPAAI